MATKTRKIHRVTATMVVVKVPGAQGGETYLRRGRRLPDSVEKDEVKRLVGLGLVETVDVEVDVPDPDPGTPATPTKPAPNAGWDKQLAWAQHLGIEVPDDVAEVKDKDKVKALIEAHEKAASESGGQ
ncbi:hypothetical protein ACFWE5_07180 [Cellulosimicrobium funkei]|uniref:hypothetical protein n=1 Tax=Cellulosimicrobium funkei TaxID=264251 RepID=UPI00365CFC57